MQCWFRESRQRWSAGQQRTMNRQRCTSRSALQDGREAFWISCEHGGARDATLASGFAADSDADAEAMPALLN